MDNKLSAGIGLPRRIVGDVLLALILGFTVYLSVIMLGRIQTVVLKQVYRQVFRRELVVCGLFLLLALDVRFSLLTRLPGAPLKFLGWLARLAVIGAAAAVLFFGARVLAGCVLHTADGTKNVIVLGLALENGRPAPDLLSRVDTARSYWEKNPDATLILTGGNPDAEGRTEAAVMRELLVERGVPAERTVLEDKASSTRENFRNTAAMLDPAEPVVLISSSYHMDRAIQTAQSAGFTNVRRLPAPSEPFPFGANVMWEIMMEINTLTARLSRRGDRVPRPPQ